MTREDQEGLRQLIDDLRSNLRRSQSLASGGRQNPLGHELERRLQLCRDSLDGIEALIKNQEVR